MLLAVSSVHGQACLGLPTQDGQGFLTAGAAFTDGAWAPGATVGYDGRGPVSVSAGYAHVLYDNSDIAVSAVGGGLAVEVPNLPVSLCPRAVVSYEWLSNEGEWAGLEPDVDGVAFGGGLSLGHRFESEASDFAFIPAVSAQVIHNRASLSFGAGESQTDSDTYAAFAGGFSLAVGRAFLTPSLGFTTLSGSDATFGIALGVALGPAPTRVDAPSEVSPGVGEPPDEQPEPTRSTLETPPVALLAVAVGSWVGSIAPLNMESYSVKMSLVPAANVGDPAGVILYTRAASSCSYFLTLDEVSEQSFWLRQSTEQAGCDSFGRIGLTPEGDDILTGRWYRPDGRFWVVGVIRRMQ
jgi:hypothetical protein